MERLVDAASGVISHVDGAVVVLVICLMNMLPLAYDLSLAALLRSGYDVTEYRHFVTVTRAVGVFGCMGEYGLVLVTLSFIFTAIYLHVTAFYPFFEHDTWLEFIVLHLGPSLYLNAAMLINFARCFFTAPGTTKSDRANDYRVPASALARIDASLKKRSVASLTPDELKAALGVLGIRYCEECQLMKPPRAHHCSTCNQCTLRMDHHCPFTAGCVGQANYRYFFLFISATVGATIYAMVLTWPAFHGCFWGAAGSAHEGDAGAGDAEPGVMHAADPVLDRLCERLGSRNRLVFLVALLAFVTLGSLLCFMTYLLANGLTMLENMPFVSSSRTPTPAAQATRLGKNPSLSQRLAFYRKNIEAVFGGALTWWRWWVPFGDLLHGLLCGAAGSRDSAGPSFDEHHYL